MTCGGGNDIGAEPSQGGAVEKELGVERWLYCEMEKSIEISLFESTASGERIYHRSLAGTSLSHFDHQLKEKSSTAREFGNFQKALDRPVTFFSPCKNPHVFEMPHSLSCCEHTQKKNKEKVL